MAGPIPYAVINEILKRLNSLIYDEVELLGHVKDELWKLSTILFTIQGRLLDADEQKENNGSIENWIWRLKDVVYDADDLLDTYATEESHRKLRKISEEVLEFFPTENPIFNPSDVALRIQDIRKRLERVAKEMSDFNFTHRYLEEGTKPREREETQPFFNEDNLFGREKDKRNIIELLMHSSNVNNVSILPIVGMGGLGKTALAQSVYNDEGVKKHFDLRMWVCLSFDFNVKLLVRKIVKYAIGYDMGDLQMDILQRKLREQLKEKKFLLVLDDCWNVNYHQWERLINLLMVGADGSKIIVTTRFEKNALIMGVREPYPLKRLLDVQSWNFFKKLTFDDKKDPPSQLIHILEKMVENCKGVPLAIETLATKFRSKIEENDWVLILEKEFGELHLDREIPHLHPNKNILPVLQLSYDNLPVYLKECFAYCSLFPRNHVIHRELLIQQWMALGYLQTSSGENLEYIGDKYSKELLSRSLFEKDENDLYLNKIRLHDLMHDLAEKVAAIGSQDTSQGVYHLSFTVSKGIDFPDARHLRTLILHGSDFDSPILDTISVKYERIRVLDLQDLNVKKVPDSISKLFHLRYLDLSNKRFEELPDSICDLRNLQTLNLSRCWNLLRLPRDIRNLINLRHLILDRCVSLTHLPAGLGKLASLRTLLPFVVGDEEDTTVCKLAELSTLNNLRGHLSIQNIERARKCASECKVPILEGKKYIESLELSWTWNNQSSNAEADEMLVECLQPPQNIKSLLIMQFGGLRLPMRVIDDELRPLLPNLVGVNIKGCYRCKNLPSFCQLPCLKFLRLSDLPCVEYIDNDSGGLPSSSAGKNLVKGGNKEKLRMFFPSLEELFLCDLGNLRGWWREAQAEVKSSKLVEKTQQLVLPSFPCLSLLEIVDCPQLTSLPFHPSVTALLMRDRSENYPTILSQQLISASAPPLLLSSLYLGIKSMEHLPEGLQHVKALQELQICDSRKLTTLPEWIGNLKSLKLVKLWRCRRLKSLPEGMRCLTALQKLVIWYCPKLEESCRRGIGKDWPKIKHIPDISLSLAEF